MKLVKNYVSIFIAVLSFASIAKADESSIHSNDIVKINNSLNSVVSGGSILIRLNSVIVECRQNDFTQSKGFHCNSVNLCSKEITFSNKDLNKIEKQMNNGIMTGQTINIQISAGSAKCRMNDLTQTPGFTCELF